MPRRGVLAAASEQFVSPDVFLANRTSLFSIGSASLASHGWVSGRADSD
jgi:hypothetical protein